MLLYFSVGGYLSFKEPQIIDFTPIKGDRILGTRYENNYHMKKTKYLPRIMKSSVLFGDNATGKTNWFYAIEDCIEIIKKGLSVDINDSFNLSKNEIEFQIGLSDINNKVYEYFLKFNDHGTIIYENLVINNKDVFLFKNKKLKINKSNKINKKLEDLYKNIEPTDTFISRLEDFLSDEIKSFIEASNNIIVNRESLINEEQKHAPSLRILTNDGKEIINKYKPEVIELLKDLDPTIDDFDIVDIRTEKKSGYEIEIIRNDIHFSIRYESRGIRKIVNLITDILQIYEGKSLLIDELDSSIGTKALIKIFNNIINTDKNDKGQLIISSHNLALLRFNIFNSSQMHIFSKNSNYETRVHSISDYNLRYEKKSLDELYLNGSFEA